MYREWSSLQCPKKVPPTFYSILHELNNRMNLIGHGGTSEGSPNGESPPSCVLSRPVVIHAYNFTEDERKALMICFKGLAIEQTPIPANALWADKLFPCDARNLLFVTVMTHWISQFTYFKVGSARVLFCLFRSTKIDIILLWKETSRLSWLSRVLEWMCCES